MTSLASKTFVSIRWNVWGMLVRNTCGFVISIILAHLLGPKPFGQIAIALLVWGFTDQFVGSGFSSAIVHRAELNEEQVRFAFTAQVLIAGGFAVGIALAAPWIASVFHDPGATNVLRAMAPLSVLQAFGQISTGLLKRRLEFRSVQIAQVTSYFIAYACIGVPAALLGAGVWSLVAAQLIQALMYSVHVYFCARHSLVPCLSRSASGLTGYGAKVAGTNLVNWSLGNLDNTVVGMFFGPVTLGLYSRAFNVCSFVADGVTSACQQVLFSTYSKTQGQLATVRRIYLGSLAFFTLILFPPFFAVSACARTVVLGLYGNKWASAGPMLRPLALAMAVTAVMATAGPVLWGANRVQNELRAQVTTLLIAVPLFFVASRFSVIALAWAVVGAYCIRCFLVGRPAWKLLGIGFGDLVRTAKGGFILAAVAMIVCSGIDWLLVRHGVRPAVVLAAVVLGGAIACLSTLVLSDGQIIDIELLELGTTVSEHLPETAVRFLRRALLTKQLSRSTGEMPANISGQHEANRSS